MRSEAGVIRSKADGDFIPDGAYFASLDEPFGPVSLGLAIGPLRLRLDGLSHGQETLLRRRFRPFTTEPMRDPTVRIVVRPAEVERFLRHPDSGRAETYRLESRQCGAEVHLWSYEFAGTMASSRRQALLALTEPEGELFNRGLENFLRVLTASCVLDSGGFLLHASGVVRGGRAYVFFGPSGSGKTTVTQLSPDDIVLSDDLTLVVRHDGRYEAAGIPFGLAHHRVPETSDSFPIASFNRLIQSREVRRESLPIARAAAEIAASLPFVMRDAIDAERAMEVTALALASIPVFRLHFRKDADFWRVVEER
jgi:hypothetical protein